MQQVKYQFLNVTPQEFEDFRKSMGTGTLKVADKIDFVAGAALAVGGTYNRNQRTLNVVVTRNETFVDSSVDLSAQIAGLVGRTAVEPPETQVQSVPVQTPKDKHTGMAVTPSGISSKKQVAVAASAKTTKLATNLKAALAASKTSATPAQPASNASFADKLSAAFAARGMKPPASVGVKPQTTAAKI